MNGHRYTLFVTVFGFVIGFGIDDYALGWRFGSIVIVWKYRNAA